MSSQVSEVIAAVRALSPELRRKLAVELEREQLLPKELTREEIVDSIWGKYAFTNTSSEEFMARKREEIEYER